MKSIINFIALHIKVILVIIAVLSGYQIYMHRFLNLHEGIVSGVIYVGLFLVLCLVIIIAAYIKNNLVRVLYALILSSAFIFNATYVRAMNDFLTYPSFISLINARGFIGDAFTQFYEPFIASVIAGLYLFTGIALKPAYRLPLPHIVSAFSPVFPILATAFLSLLLFVRGGEGTDGLPGAFTPLAFSNLFLYEVMANEIEERKGVFISSTEVENNRDIVFIVDESVRGDYLDINSNYGVESGLKKAYKNIKVYNYGLAASIATCSAEVNVDLRYGGTRDKYLYMINSMPSIWVDYPQYFLFSLIDYRLADITAEDMLLKNMKVPRTVALICGVHGPNRNLQSTITQILK